MQTKACKATAAARGPGPVVRRKVHRSLHSIRDQIRNSRRQSTEYIVAPPGQVSHGFRPEFSEQPSLSPPQGSHFLCYMIPVADEVLLVGESLCLFKLVSFISHWFFQPYGSLNTIRNWNRPSCFESLDSNCTWMVLKCSVLIFSQCHTYSSCFHSSGYWIRGLC